MGYGWASDVWSKPWTSTKCASVMLNSGCCRHYPKIIDAGKERNWAWIAHGKNNSIFQADMTVEQERSYLTEVVKTISDATAHQVKGWLSPALAETFETPKILNELDLSYVVEAIGIAGR
jgi:hypothetical protein